MKLKINGKGKILPDDEEARIIAKEEFFGTRSGEKIYFMPEEALYLLKFKRAEVFDGSGNRMNFSSILSKFSKSDKNIFVKYNTLRDWRDRGLILRKMNKKVKSKHAKKLTKKYPSGKLEKVNINVPVLWFPKTMFSLVEDVETGRLLYVKYWFGQYGIYKQKRQDEMLKLDFLETVFLSKHFGATVIDMKRGGETTWENVLKYVVRKREHARQLYEVYEDWRLRSYVVKTGLKFGAHFRVYFPGASPERESKWIHSRHVLHVFPKRQKLVVSEWARAVRVAHGVKKTFILCIPGMGEKEYVKVEGDFLGYRRKREGGKFVREVPKDKPRYFIVCLSEDEYIGGVELASMLREAKKMGLNLLLAITDRDTAITYYLLRRIILPGSEYEYYEIEWFKP